MRKVMLLSAAIAVLFISPVQANPIGDILHDFDHHCSASGGELHCSISNESSHKLPDKVITSPSVSRGPVTTECGFEMINPNGMKNSDGSLFCVADYTGWMDRNGSSTTIHGGTEYACTTKSVTVKLHPFSTDFQNVTVSGHC